MYKQLFCMYILVFIQMGTKLYILYCNWRFITHVLLYKMYEQMNIVTELQACKVDIS